MRRLFMLLVLLASAAPAADPDIREIFEKARIMADQNQNLTEAIRLFGQVVSMARSERVLAAQAQAQQGLLYERLGRKQEAQNAFRAVLNNFSDQAAVVALARLKLPPAIPETRTRIVWTGDEALGADSVSPDGRLFSGYDRKTGDLLVYDVETKQSRLLVKNSSLPGGGARISAFSRDGKWLVFPWLPVPDGPPAEIRIIGLDGSGQRTICQFRTPARVDDCDGKSILAALMGREHELRLISIADGSSRVLPVSANWRGNRARLSPDGQYVAYNAQAASDNPIQEIRVISVTSGVDQALIPNPVNEAVLDWSGDGSRLVLASQRSNETALWAIPMAGGRAQGELEMVKQEPGGIDGAIGITRQDSLMYSVRQSFQEVFLSQLDPAARTGSAPELVSDRFPRAKWSPAWSPDERTVAYLSGGKLRLRDMANGTERDVLPELRQTSLILSWPDPRSVIVQGVAKGPKPGTYRLDVETGVATLLLPVTFDLPAFSHDFQTAYLPAGADDPPGILSQNLATGEKKMLYARTAGEDVSNPSLTLSPDEKLLAFQSPRPDGSVSLEVMPAGGGEPRVLLRLPHSEHFARNSFSWSPDSRSIFAVRVEGDHSEIWRVPLDGGPAQSTGISLPGIIRNMRLSPSGRQVAFTNDRSANQIWVLENFLPRVPAAQAGRKN